MKAFFVLLVWILGLVQAEQKSKELTEIDLVLNRLHKQSWSHEELPCFKETVFLLENAKNYTVWAMMVWNSMQRPVGTFFGTLYSLGSYDQCIQNIPNDNNTITTQYCLADVILTRKQFEENKRNIMFSSETYLGVRTKVKRDLSRITWGTCLPASCKPGSVAKILKVIYLVNPITPDEPCITVDHCQVAGEEIQYTTGFYMFVALIIGLITAVLLSIFYVTYADFILQVCNSMKRRVGMFNGTPCCLGLLTRVLECFNLKRNFLSLTKDSSADDIPTLSLVKAFASPSIVIVHTVYFELAGPINNIVVSDQMVSFTHLSAIMHSILKNADLSIEVFLIISGIFYIKGLMKKRRHPLISLLNRYFRLIGTYAIVTFYTVSVSMYTGDGPMWTKLAGREQSASSVSWFWSLLMLNNYIGSENFSILVSWYIHCDFQLTIMATIIFMLWQKDKRLAKFVTMLIFILGILSPAVVTYWKKLPVVFMFDDIEKVLDVRKNEVFLVTYIQSQYRTTTYMLGMGLGYIMTVYKPTKSRKCLSMKMSVTIFVMVCYCGSFIMDAVVSWCGNDEVLAAAVDTAFRRLLFGIKACSFFLVIEYGNFSGTGAQISNIAFIISAYLQKVAELRIITIMSRLAYGIYMTHTIVLNHTIYSRRVPHHMVHITEFIYGLGVWATCLVISIPVWFLVEAPISNIFHLITNFSRKPKSVTGMKSKEDMD